MATDFPLAARATGALLASLLLASGCGDDAVVKQASLVTTGDAGGDSGIPGQDGTTGDAVSEIEGDGGDFDSTRRGGSDGTDLDASVGETADDVATPLDSGDASLDAKPQVCPGDPGCKCASDSECASGACLASSTGPACAAPCITDVPCPTGTACATLPGADTTTSDDDLTVCAAKWPTYCDPCELASECTSVAVPLAACISLPGATGKGLFCATPCKSDSQCPTGAVCSETTGTDGNSASYCVPSNGQCTCSEAAAGKGTACFVEVTLPSGTTATCAGTRSCGANGLTDCSAATPQPETCNGLDDDCNGQTDEGAACNDGNPCTADACSTGKCVGLPQAATCDDANACTVSDGCLDGNCAGMPTVCDDKNGCTVDSCEKTKGCVYTPSDGGSCDDGDPCTGGDTCKGGVCLPTAVDICPCASDSDCTAKEDGNLCNGTLYCNKAKVPAVCTVNPASVVVCDPKNDTVCAVAACAPSTGKCAPLPQNSGVVCSDSSLCTSGDLCASGTCSGALVSCDDGNSCTADSCDPATGCKHSNTTDVCSDNNPCTLGDSCSVGACTTTAKSCDDGFACTTDSCDAASGDCQNNLVASQVCGVVPVPWSTDLACDATTALALWQRSDWALAADAVRWGFDNAPALTPDSTCSLNINNNKDLSCGSGQATIDAVALTPWLDAGALAIGKPLAIRFDSAGSWAPQHSATVAARIAGGEWIALGTVAAPTSSAWTAVQLPITGMAGKQLQVKLSFSGPCAAGQLGWFVDNIAVFADTCADGSANCPANNVCSADAKGQAVCTACPGGYQVKSGTCVDIDECAAPTTCSANATCANTPGSFSCTCKAGFEGPTCADVDECAKGTSGCEATSVCVNSPGSFACSCPSLLVPVGKGCAKKGSQAAAPALSCLEILTLDPTSGDGAYWLDVDGPGGQTAVQYYCDMKGGGWTLLIFDNFDNNSPSGWAAGSVQGCGSYGAILGGAGQLGKGAVTSKKVASPPHTNLKLGMNYIRLDSWDNETGVVQIDGNNVWTKKGTGNWLLFGVNNVCGSNNYSDEEWGVAYSGAHTGTSVTVSASSTLDQDAGDESFGIDNIALWVK